MHSTALSPTSKAVEYDPFVRGRFPASVRTTRHWTRRGIACSLARSGIPKPQKEGPLILYSHHSGGHRRAASFLCDHLSSHGYVVAALDHSEVVAEELKGREGETAEQLSARVEAWIANRVPDIRFLLDHVLNGAEATSIPIESESWDTASAVGPRWLRLRSRRVSEP